MKSSVIDWPEHGDRIVQVQVVNQFCRLGRIVPAIDPSLTNVGRQHQKNVFPFTLLSSLLDGWQRANQRFEISEVVIMADVKNPVTMFIRSEHCDLPRLELLLGGGKRMRVESEGQDLKPDAAQFVGMADAFGKGSGRRNVDLRLSDRCAREP